MQRRKTNEPRIIRCGSDALFRTLSVLTVLHGRFDPSSIVINTDNVPVSQQPVADFRQSCTWSLWIMVWDAAPLSRECRQVGKVDCHRVVMKRRQSPR